MEPEPELMSGVPLVSGVADTFAGGGEERAYPIQRVSFAASVSVGFVLGSVSYVARVAGWRAGSHATGLLPAKAFGSRPAGHAWQPSQRSNTCLGGLIRGRSPTTLT